MIIQYYVFFTWRQGNSSEGHVVIDSTPEGWHGLYLCPSECQWMVPGTVDPNDGFEAYKKQNHR